MKALFIGLSLLFLFSGWSQTWYTIPVPTTNNLHKINFASESVGYIVGDSTTLLKTTDGGVNWFAVDHFGLDEDAFSHQIVDVKFMNELIGYVVILNEFNGVYKTEDGGLTWSPAFNEDNMAMCYKSSIYLNDEYDYYVGGAGCFQSGMIDHYNAPLWYISSIDYESFNPEEYIVEMDFNSNVGIAVMNGEYFLRSEDYGATWDSIPSMIGEDQKLTSVMFASEDTVYAGYEGYLLGELGFLISTDGGLTWENMFIAAAFYYDLVRGIAKSNNQTLYAGGKSSASSAGVIYRSTDWTYWSQTSVLRPINDLDSYGDDITFGVGDSGFVVVNTPLESLAIEEEMTSLINVYPNPSKEFITIKGQFEAPVSYQLCNTQGKIMLSGTFTAAQSTLDINDFPKGLYYLKVNTGTQQIVNKIVKH